MALRVLLALQHLFMLWMLIDAIRRRAEFYWYIVIFVPFGEWAYFFVVKIHDFRKPGGRGPFRIFGPRAPTLDELSYQAEQTPSLLNKRNLADGLHDAGRYEEALQAYAKVIARDANDKAALYGHASCNRSLDRPEDAVADLRRLLSLDAAYRDREPWLELAAIHREQGELSKAERLLRELVRLSARMPYQLALAELLVEMGTMDEARELLDKALVDYGHAPRYQRRNESGAASQARRLLKTLT